MRKLVVVTIVVLASLFSAHAQPMSKHALGLKFGAGVGDFIGTNSDISYQRAMSSINRLELNLGLSFNSSFTRFSLGGFYQWVYNINGGLNWYVGPGANVGIYSPDNGNSSLMLGVAGQAGLEYRFNFPLQLTLDVNPYLGVINSEGFNMPIALGVRYMF